MYYYCEKCKTLSKEPNCDKCGCSINEAKPDDICYVSTLAHFYATMYKEALKNQNIPFFSLPTGFSFDTKASSGEKIFVPFEFYKNAIEIYYDIFIPDDDADNEEDAGDTMSNEKDCEKCD